MKKLLHERLREVANKDHVISFEGDGYVIALWPSESHALADEIERYYIPRPRFEDGEPVQFGEEATYGFPSLSNQNFKVARMNFYKDGSITLCEYGGNGHNYQPDELVKRPSPKVLDADGVEIKVGDTVWHVITGDKHIVEELLDDGGLYIDKSSFTWDSSVFTHKAPDSLEKLRDDMESWNELRMKTFCDEWIDRLSALIERGK